VLSLLRILWQVLGPDIKAHRKACYQSFGLSLLMTAAGLAGPVAVFYLLDAAYRSNRPDLIPVYAFLTLGAYAAYASLTSVYRECAQRTTEAIVFDLKCRLISAVMRKPVQFHDEINQSALSAVLTRDIERLSDFLRAYALPVLSSGLFACLILLVLLLLDWRLGLLVICIVPLMIYATIKDFTGKTASEATQTDVDARQNAAIADVFDGARTIRLFQLRPQIEQWFRAGAGDVRDYFLMVNAARPFGWGARARFASVLIWLAPLILALSLLHWGAQGITVGLIVAFKTYAPMLSANLNAVAAGVLAYAKLGSTVVRLRDVFAYPEEREPEPPSLEAMPGQHDLEVQDLSYVRGGRTLFDGLSFRLAPGERVGVIGPNGAGKTTLGDLLLRLQDPHSGSILLDGQDVRTFALPLYLSYFAHVAQQVHILHTSVRDNIALGWRHVPDADVEHAARLVRLHEAITAMPQGYQTELGKTNQPLSAGQRQRIGLARALIREPAILILDEFTAMLDPETEAAVLDDLLNAFTDTTILCITHSPAVMERMDRVIRLPDGAELTPETAAASADRARVGASPDSSGADTTETLSDAAEITLQAQHAELQRLADWVAARCDALQVPQSLRFEFDLVLEELVANVIDHGELHDADATIRVGLTRDDGEVVITLTDPGKPFDPTQAPSPDIAADMTERNIGGLGLHLVQSYMDSVVYHRVGNENRVVLRKILAPAWKSDEQ